MLALWQKTSFAPSSLDNHVAINSLEYYFFLASFVTNRVVCHGIGDVNALAVLYPRAFDSTLYLTRVRREFLYRLDMVMIEYLQV
jgi:hypothetical protein